MKRRYGLTGPLIKVIEPKIGHLYHVDFAGRGVVGRCVKVFKYTKRVQLERPKTRTLFKHLIAWDQLRHTRKNQVTNPH